jgi:hypothetical protein
MKGYYVVCSRCKLYQWWKNNSSPEGSQLCSTCGAELPKPDLNQAYLLSEKGEQQIRDLFARYGLGNASEWDHVQTERFFYVLISIIDNEIQGAIRQSECWFFQRIGRPCNQ